MDFEVGKSGTGQGACTSISVLNQATYQSLLDQEVAQLRSGYQCVVTCGRLSIITGLDYWTGLQPLD